MDLNFPTNRRLDQPCDRPEAKAGRGRGRRTTSIHRSGFRASLLVLTGTLLGSTSGSSLASVVPAARNETVLVAIAEPPTFDAAPLTTSTDSKSLTDFDRQLAEIDAKAAKITDVRAKFEQVKHSSLLVEPLVSKGEVIAKGGVTLWSTTEPDATRMRIDQASMRVYYVKSNVIEEYSIERGLASMAATPLPKLETLRAMFTIAPDACEGMAPLQAAEQRLGVKLTPISSDLRKHVGSVRVLLDAERGTVLVFEVTDPDGERTTIRFSSIAVSKGIDDDQLDLRAPTDARLVRPFDAKLVR